MRRLYAGRELTIETEVSPAHEIQGRREDLDEMLGNLLDNACKWARSRVAISSAIDQAQLSISVDDDGPGLDPSLRVEVLQRGVRADQQVRGSGLGLAIVSDLAELYDGSVTLETSPLGGTRARLQLPRP
jgi:signal transduction histidine kinase